MIADKIGLEIMSNRFQAIVDEMAQALFRTAHTVFIKETQDYGAALVSTSGEVFAASRRYGVLMMIGKPMDDAIRAMGEDVREGDIFITNDPEATRGMATHLSDVYLWAPIFHAGKVVCYVWSFVHMTDVGGRVSGSIAPSSYELVQEGIRVPPQKLFREGVLDETFLKMFLANTRTGEQNWGDMKACIAALTTGQRRLAELISRFDASTVSRSIDDVLSYAEAQARRIISTVPEGVYRFEDFIEGDMAGLGLLRVALKLTVTNGEFHMDFTGTAPEVRAALNLPSFSKDGHWMLVTGVVNWLCTRDPNIAYNAGLVRPLKISIPKGTIINPESGAAYGARYSTSHKVCDVIIGALAQAVPDQLPATDSGQGGILMVATPDPKTSETRVSVVQPVVGGSGGRPMADGVDGTMVILNFLKNVPTELLEREMPDILIRRYGLREDSGGAGKYRGGTGSVIEFETHAPFSTVTARNLERYIFPPAGRQGGEPGTTGYTLLNPGTEAEQDIGKIDILHVGIGDIIRMGTQGGGGYGDPLERPAKQVQSDVLDGYVSVETAARSYGVVIGAEGALDEVATEARRAELRAERGDAPLKPIDFGPAREAYNQLWPSALHDAISEILAPLPRVQRQTGHQALYAEIGQRLEAGTKVAPEDVPAIYAELRAGKLNARRMARPL
ncbi:hydantoinase B/oxoprolinase family protein [Paracoccus aminophilus]|uniref:N-methylhydantoinase B n=1 Tax=Paracoccus aminophilus JCM 7686 TaxID=1367847 RepID=S5YZP6_PARAH|nr:hydantoinase B/oxoprolinase family protein [Paracoccus aminophilus]AGT10681.1 N-methylhydantoinase B [Paracoccus aminophilus JCM 7686]